MELSGGVGLIQKNVIAVLLAAAAGAVPAVAAAPPEVQNLELNGSVVLWDAVPGATMYRVVRGTVSDLPELCGAGYEFATDNFFFFDPQVPAPALGEGLVYAVSALELDLGGSLGQTSGGVSRETLLQCDSDNDLLVD